MEAGRGTALVNIDLAISSSEASVAMAGIV